MHEYFKQLTTVAPYTATLLVSVTIILLFIIAYWLILFFENPINMIRKPTIKENRIKEAESISNIIRKVTRPHEKYIGIVFLILVVDYFLLGSILTNQILNTVKKASGKASGALDDLIKKISD